LAFVIGPNGMPNEIPDDVAACLVGDGDRGYAYAPEPKPEPVKRAPRRTTSK
jgi:hypothetical protein